LNLFFEAEHFAATLIAHRTYGMVTNLSRGESWNWRRRLGVGKRFLERGQQVQGLGESSKLPQRALGQSPDHFGRPESPENVSSGRKCHLLPVSRFDSAEPLDAIGGTLSFCRTAVENTAL